jgi:anti-sigma B factor antagonist
VVDALGEVAFFLMLACSAFALSSLLKSWHRGQESRLSGWRVLARAGTTSTEAPADRLDVLRVRHRAIVTLKGSIDVEVAPELDRRLSQLVSEGISHLVVNLEEASLRDASGLGLLAHALELLRARGGDLSLVCPEGRMLVIFETTRLAQQVAIYPSVQEAIKRVAS